MSKKKKKKKKDWKNMKSSAIAKMIKERLDGSGEGFSGPGQIIRFQKGDNKVRLLPYPCHEERLVYISTKDGWRTFRYNDFFAKLRKMNEEFSEKFKPASVWMWNAIDRKNETDDDGNLVGSVLMHKFQVFEGISEKCEEYGPVMDAKKGRDLNIKRKEKGKGKKKQVSYSVLKASKKKPLTEEEMEIEPVDLEELADKLWNKSEKDILKALGLSKKQLRKLEEEDDDDYEEPEDDEDEDEDEDDDSEGDDEDDDEEEDEEDEDSDDEDEDEDDDDEVDDDEEDDDEEEEEKPKKKKKKKGKKKKDDIPF